MRGALENGRGNSVFWGVKSSAGGLLGRGGAVPSLIPGSPEIPRMLASWPMLSLGAENSENLALRTDLSKGEAAFWWRRTSDPAIAP